MSRSNPPTEDDSGAASWLVEGWLRARSIGRGLPPPVPDHGGWRVDTDSAQERARHVSAAPCEGLRELAHAVLETRVFLKVCAGDSVLRSMVPSRWSLHPPSWFMTCDGPQASAPLPPGYRSEVREDERGLHVRLLTTAGDLAASGHAIELGGVMAFDRIETTPAHRRCGLGGAVMDALLARRRSASSLPVLVATAQGRALYRILGWRERSPYATAVIED